MFKTHVALTTIVLGFALLPAFRQGLAQDVKPPKDPPKIEKKEHKEEIAPITSKLVIYTPKIGDVLSYETNIDEKGNYRKKTYHQDRIIANVDKNGSITLLIKDLEFGDLSYTEWFSPKENFLDNFPTLRKEYSSYKVGKWSIPMVTFEGDDGVKASFAMHGPRLVFPPQLFLARNGKTLVRLVKISRQDESKPTQMEKKEK